TPEAQGFRSSCCFPLPQCQPGLKSAFQNEVPSRVASAEGRPSPAAQAAGRWAGTGSAKRARRDTGRSIAEGERQRSRPLAAASQRAGPLSSCSKTVYGSSRSGPARPEGYFETCSEGLLRLKSALFLSVALLF